MRSLLTSFDSWGKCIQAKSFTFLLGWIPTNRQISCSDKISRRLRRRIRERRTASVSGKPPPDLVERSRNKIQVRSGFNGNQLLLWQGLFRCRSRNFLKFHEVMEGNADSVQPLLKKALSFGKKLFTGLSGRAILPES